MNEACPLGTINLPNEIRHPKAKSNPMVLAKPDNCPVLEAFQLHGQVAAVTGGSRGIGIEVVRGLAEAGADVALIYTSAKDAEENAEKISKECNVRCHAFKSDVSDPALIKKTLQDVASHFGRLDIVVANAGVASHIEMLDYTYEQYRHIMGINQDGAFFTAQAAGEIFKRQGHGNLIFTASVSARLVNLPQRQAAYNASKAAVVHLAKCLAVEWVDFCRVNCVSPGFISTDMIDFLPEDWKKEWLRMTPGQRFCDTYELKGVYVFLASKASSYTTGHDVVVDGGYTLP